MKTNSIIVIGLPGAGKTFTSGILKDLGWFIVSAGDIIRKMCINEKLKTDRETLQKYGSELLKNKGEIYFSHLLMEAARDKEKVVFEGIRPIIAIENIRRELNAAIVYIEASKSTRYLRLHSRDSISIDSFNSLENNDLEKQIVNMKNNSDFILINDSNKDNLIKKIKDIVNGY